MPKASQRNALLVGTRRRGVTTSDALESLDELAELLATAGGVDVGRILCDVPVVNARTFIGQGKLAQVAERAAGDDVDFVLFDDDLSPSQQRNIEETTGKMVLDRTGLILDIFAMRARSAEGKLQVELAQLEYLLPRLRGMWTHLSRQGAGIGTRGPGETDLEIDRRRIQEKITRIKKRIDHVRRTRSLHRAARERVPYETASLIGYTNAGKSTLFNALSGADALAENRLFATLDPTTREIELARGERMLVSDTVGFIRKLPHQLVESFKATFEEVTSSAHLLHVIDASHEAVDHHIEAVHTVLAEIGIPAGDVISVLNKIDRCEHPAVVTRLTRELPSAVAVSARTGEGLGELRAMLAGRLHRGRSRIDVSIPAGRGDLLSALHRDGTVVSEFVEGENVNIRAWVSPRLRAAVAEFVQ